jgi:hypothetical protein
MLLNLNTYESYESYFKFVKIHYGDQSFLANLTLIGVRTHAQFSPVLGGICRWEESVLLAAKHFPHHGFV